MPERSRKNPPGKDPIAVELGRRGGLKGGKARAAKMTAEERAADIDTVGGLVFTLAGRVPARGEVISHPGGWEFRVLEADARRIRRVRVRRTVPAEAPVQSEAAE